MACTANRSYLPSPALARWMNWLRVGSFIVAAACSTREVVMMADEPSVGASLKTRWAAEVDPERVLPEYPRPSLVRPRWSNLNGSWEYAIRPAGESLPQTFDGSILVPFPVESQLSGVEKTVGPDNALWYRRTFEIPDSWEGERLLLHFGAVDWRAEVWIDGQAAGQHEGGYDPFSFDITDVLALDRKRHELVVKVIDPTDAGPQPRGKQVLKPGGIWYTPVTGIWQTVWLEPVPKHAIASLRFEADIESGRVEALLGLRGAPVENLRWRMKVSSEGGNSEFEAQGTVADGIAVQLTKPRLWSPQDPTLYDVSLELLEGEEVLDAVTSYFAFRSIEIASDEAGVPRLKLNGETLFQFGTLDQGWWPDGLYTAPTDGALRYDIEVTQKLGFNLIRKHVKVEPERWYWHCDRMGMLVWQDMPSGGVNEPWPVDGTEGKRDVRGTEIFGRELDAMVASRRFHPCIVAWVPFNEAWGQFQTEFWTEHVEQLDPSRIVISASGGNDFGVGDARDIHNYPAPEAPPLERHRVAILGEYGGLGLPLRGHTWQDESNWGYRSFTTTQELQATYLRYIEQLRPMIESRLAAAIYTQTTDVEVETNGLMTYDREVLKFEVDALAAAHAKLFERVPTERTAEEASMAATIAYWRFEEGEPGMAVPHDREVREAMAVRDVSGQDNHLYAWAEANAPHVTDQVAAETIPLTGATNRRALDDLPGTEGATRDVYTDPGRAGTHMSVIGNFPFRDFTIEFSVARREDSRPGTLIGEDGRPTAGPEAPLQIALDTEQRISVVLIDRQGNVRRLSAPEPLAVDQWSHWVLRGDVLNETVVLGQVVDGRFVEVDRETMRGGLVLSPGTWTLGRGFDDGKLGRDGAARLDEVRVSTIPLPDAWLLWTESR